MHNANVKNNQNGFSLTHVLLLLVVVGVVSGSGWYVWSSNNKTASKVSSNKSGTVGNKPSLNKAPAETPPNWSSYRNSQLGISFAYPKNWTFVDKSAEPASTKSYYVGELSSDDKATSVAITLVRKKDGRNVRASIDEWKASAKNSNLKYGDLTEVKSHYVSFSYINYLDEAKKASNLKYQILDPANSVQLLVLPTATNHKVLIDQVVGTLRFE